MIVSIVIAAASGEPVTGRCIASVRQFAGDERLEFVVLPCEQSSIFRTRAEGIERATGDRIAVLGDRYEVTPAWIERLLRGGGAAVAAGCIAPGSHMTYWGWCVYLCEYAHVAPPVTPGETRQPKLAPGGNMVYSRAIVRQFPPARATSELSFHATLIEAGVNLRLCPELEVEFASPPGAGYVVERFLHSRAIGREGGARKLLIAPLLPLVAPMRIGAAILSRGRYLTRFLLCVPVIVLLGVVQAAGEFTGALGALRKTK